MRRAIEEHLLSSPNLALTSNSEVTSLDNQLETCRVAALIYVTHALRPELDAKYPSVALKPLITLGRWTKLELILRSTLNCQRHRWRTLGSFWASISGSGPRLSFFRNCSL